MTTTARKHAPSDLQAVRKLQLQTHDHYRNRRSPTHYNRSNRRSYCRVR